MALKRSERRLVAFFAALPMSVVLFGLLYMAGMRLLEGEVRGFWESVGWAAETLTTTGYGRDAAWQHPLMWVLVIFVQFTGVLMVVAVFPIYLIPFFEERFEGRLPSVHDYDLEGRVLLNRHGHAIDRLLRELEAAGLEPVVFEEDEVRARALFRRGVNVAYGSAEHPETIAAFTKASAIVTNGPDDEDAAMILGVRGRGFEGPIVGLVSAPAHRHPLVLAGATAAYTPRHLLAAELCGRTSARISPRLSRLGSLDEAHAVFEMRVYADSKIEGSSLATLEAQVPGAEVVALVEGEERLVELPSDHVLKRGARVILRAPLKSKDDLTSLVAGERAGGQICLLGDGEVARKIKQMLTDAGEQVTLVASEAGPNVDAHGDLLDPATLREAGVRDAAAVVLALENDAATLFVGTVLQAHATDVPVVAGLKRGHRIERTRAVGIGHVVALDDVMGRVLAHHVLEGRRGDIGLVVRRQRAGGLAPHPSDVAAILARTGCAVLGVYEDDVLRAVKDGESIRANTEVQLCGALMALRTHEN